MANRFSDVTTSTYQPLSLQEIMMVPTAKQAQHDAAQAAADEYAALSAKRLQQDASAVDARLGELRGTADTISQNLLERGVSREAMAQIHALKREKEKEYSQQGLIGNAQANYETATKFINDLAEKKERQAGWSPANAKAWAMQQVGQFKGTLDDAGTFRTFQGKELDEYVDQNKWLNDNVAQVAADTHNIDLKKWGTVANFTDAFMHGQVEELDKMKIIKALMTRAQYDPKLQASLAQGQFFSPEKDATNIGEVKIVKDKNGHPHETFVPGSRFGMQLAGLAMGKAYRKEDMKYMTVDDKLGFEMMKRGLDKKDADNAVLSLQGQISDIDPINYETLQKTLSIADNDTNVKSQQLKMRYEQLKAAGYDPSKDAKYKDMEKELEVSKTKLSNAKASLDNIMTNANKNMIPQEKAMLAEHGIVTNQIERIRSGIQSLGPRLEAAIKEGKDIKRDYLRKQFNDLGITPDVLKKYGVDPNGKNTYSDLIKNTTIMKGLLLQQRGALNKGLTSKQLYEKINHIEQRQKLASNNARAYIKDNPMSQGYTEYDGTDVGEYKSTVGAMVAQLDKSFESTSGRAWSKANGGGSLNKEIAEAIEAAKDDGVTYHVKPTNGRDSQGHPIETVIIKNKKTGETLYSIPSTRGKDGEPTQMAVAKSLMNSDGFKKDGERIMLNQKYGKDLSRMGINQHSFTGGVLPGRTTADGKLIYIDRENIGRPGSGNYAFRVKLIDKSDWINNQKVTTYSQSNSLGGYNDIIDALPE